MAAPTRSERLTEKLVEALLESNKALVEAVRALSSGQTVTTVAQAHDLPVAPIRFEDIPEDDWDRPERLWVREDEEDAEHAAVMGGEATTPDPRRTPIPRELLASALAEAGLAPTITTS